ncbi:YncE family protein [Salinibacter altiplanensis]|uniref:YVTN family beta-propeller repeat protein n=1 Tax=Salinibacter altiplanensis TaxID=1803181 RepID=UPI000C9F2EB6|nr:YncE family protein [Salinibacter altiplanensis]
MPRAPFTLTIVAVLVAGVALALYGPGTGEPALLIANKNGASLYVVDPASGQVTDSVSTGAGPHEVAAAPKTRRAFVANYGDGTISAIDVDGPTETARWQLPATQRPHGIGVGPNEERVYVTAEDRQAVLELDAASGTVRRTFETGRDVTHMLALAPNAPALYATSIGSGTLSKVDLETGDVGPHVATGAGAEGLGVTPDGEEVWVTNRADDTVSILHAASTSERDTLSVDGFPIRVDVSPDGRHALVSAPRAGEVALYNAQSRRLMTRLEVGSKPIGVLAPTDDRAYVANAGSGTVSIVDLNARAVTDTIPAGRGPDGMAYVPAL